MIRSESFPTDSPEYQLMEFLHAWKKGKYKTMVSHCQKTWLSGKKDPSQALRLMFEHATLETAEIIDIDRNINVSNKKLKIKMEDGLVCDILISLKVNTITHVRKVRLLKEEDAYDLSENGDWGVNPISMLREIK